MERSSTSTVTLQKNSTLKLTARVSNQSSPVQQPPPVKYCWGLLEFKTELVWPNIIGFAILHAGGIWGTWVILRQFYNFQFALYAFNWCIGKISCQGVTAGAHRLFTHRTYKAKTPLKVLLLLLHTIAGQNCMYIWVRDHRQHHKFSDTDADPHNANRGFFFSHIGWLMMKKHPEVIRKGPQISLVDLEQEPLVMFQKKYYYALYTVCLFILLAIPYYIMGETFSDVIAVAFYRMCHMLNVTWAVNSVAHLWGTKPFDKDIYPVESRLVSSLTSGEGWHNYHHTFPWDYKASEFGATDNFTTTFIEFMARWGQAYDLKSASPVQVENRARRTGDGSWRGSDREGRQPEEEQLHRGW